MVGGCGCRNGTRLEIDRNGLQDDGRNQQIRRKSGVHAAYGRQFDRFGTDIKDRNDLGKGLVQK